MCINIGDVHQFISHCLILGPHSVTLETLQMYLLLLYLARDIKSGDYVECLCPFKVATLCTVSIFRQSLTNKGMSITQISQLAIEYRISIQTSLEIVIEYLLWLLFNISHTAETFKFSVIGNLHIGSRVGFWELCFNIMVIVWFYAIFCPSAFEYRAPRC